MSGLPLMLCGHVSMQLGLSSRIDPCTRAQIADMFRMQARRLDVGGNGDEDGV